MADAFAIVPFDSDSDDEGTVSMAPRSGIGALVATPVTFRVALNPLAVRDVDEGEGVSIHGSIQVRVSSLILSLPHCPPHQLPKAPLRSAVNRAVCIS